MDFECGKCGVFFKSFIACSINTSNKSARDHINQVHQSNEQLPMCHWVKTTWKEYLFKKAY